MWAILIVVVLANFISGFLQVIWMRKTIGLQFSEYVRCWIPGLWLTTIVIFPIVFLRLFEIGIPILNIVVGGLACLVACVLGLLILHRSGVPLERSRIG